MKLFSCITVLTLVGLTLAAPTFSNNETITITSDFYVNDLVKYTAKYNIVNLLMPLNSINFDENESSESDSNENESNIILFFVEADVDADGKRVDKGLYVLKNNDATLLLENGRDAAASTDNSTSVFLGAKDGIYVYNKEKNTAEKYGTVDDSIVSIAKEKSGDIIYILNENGEVYKVSENGNKKDQINDIVNAKEIVLDYSNNLYFYSNDKQAKVRTADGVKTIEGLPQNPTNVKLIRPPFIVEDGVLLNVDNTVYVIYANATSETSGFDFGPNSTPTAYAPEAVLLQYYAYEKKIYEYNILVLILSEILDELKQYLNEKASDIRALAARSKVQRHS